MQNRQSNFQTKQRRSRVLLAVMTAFSLIAASGMFTAPVEAQGPAQFVFQGSGWGHGVGMSQNGARNAANSGMEHVGILNFYYPNTIVSQVGTLDPIRVHIGDAERVELSSSGSITFERGGVAINAIPSGSITVSAHDGGLQIGNAWTSGSPSDPLFVSFPQPVKLGNNGHSYLWGRLQITNKNGKVRVVEVLTLEEYVAGIAEMPAAWPLEALMAQAIAARTYAHEITLHRRNSAEWAQEYDISGSTVDQNYIGYDAQDSAWDQKWLAAVSATAGVEIVDSNGPVRAYYSASNGGYTETAAYVFDNDVAHTVAGPDPYDAGGHDWTQWTRTYTQESLSRWLNAHADTAVGTVSSITVGGGAGASARIDNAVVEIVGAEGTKRVTGRRLMLVMNAGIFGEGGGLSTHLPGTFTTIGNGAGVGYPQPSGIPVPATITPDPQAEAVDVNEDFTPPPGWQPTPGTGVAPGASANSAAADSDTATVGADGGILAEDGTFTPAEGWEPTPGTGVAPGEAASEAPAATTTETFTPPPGWQPEPGTGVAPSVVPASSTSDANETTADVVSTSGAYTPPADWQPTPGSGVSPNAEPASESTETSTETTTADTEIADTETVGGTGGGAAPVAADWQPEPGTGVAPSVTGSANATAAASEYAPPAGWTPEPGTGVTPGQASSASSADYLGGESLASGVFLVTRTADGADLTDATFEVIAPTADLAAEAKERLEALQAKAALGLFADIDVDGYVASVAPRPVHGVCTATADGSITCVPLEALQTGAN